MGKQKHSKVKGFLNFSCEAEIHAVPTTWDEWFPTLREKYEKTKAFQSYIFHLNQKPIQFPTSGQSEFPYYGASMGKHRQFPGSTLFYRFRVNENSCNSHCLGMYKFP